MTDQTCPTCHGDGIVANPYAHECDSELCQDPHTIPCDECDGTGTQ
jgi:DnaJ-class molecular chaperone